MTENIAISIHAPLTGSDPADRIATRRRLGFQSTLPLRGATCCLRRKETACIISIHAPLTGSDVGVRAKESKRRNFNPRSPYGERPVGSRRGKRIICTFQSTLPLRGATQTLEKLGIFPDISIHAPLTGSDRVTEYFASCPCYFNPRSPYGERRNGWPKGSKQKQFQSTLPLRGATKPCGVVLCLHRFQSTLPLRGAT